tara:strand:- start:704 stop:1576 length:873 start_codon:yes stop_codon:yes gene_type:complete
MPFLGNQPQQGFANSVVKDDFTPNGSTTAFTLSKSAASANDIEVYVGNVRQEPTDAYTVNGTTLTMSEAPASGLNFYVMHIQGTVESTIAPQANSVGASQLQNNAVTVAKLASTLDLSSNTVTLPSGTGGKVLQVLQTFVGTTATIASSNTSNYADFPGLSVTITPASTSSKILVQADVNHGFQVGTLHMQLARGSTPIGVHTGTLGGTRIASGKSFRVAATPYAIQSGSTTLTHLDSPSTTSATTYKVQGTLGATYNSNFYLNRPYHMGDSNDYNARSASSIVVMEIAQ